MEAIDQTIQVRDLLMEIGKIVEGAVTGNPESVIAYAEQLGTKLEDAGETACAGRVREILKRKTARQMSLSRTTSNRRVPVDSESRLPVADSESISASDSKVILSPETQLAIARFVRCYRAADQFAATGVDLAASVLLYGPPGCGKTQLARHIASEVGLPLLTARMDSLISSYLGSTSKNLRALFDYAASEPCVLFLDEFDALAKLRDDARELGELKRVVISLLQNIDILGRDHVLIAATNHEHLLDPAVWRRFAHRIYIGLPDVDARRVLLETFSHGYLTVETISTLSCLTEGLSGSVLKDVAEECVRDAILSEKPVADMEDAIETCLRMTTSTMGERLLMLYESDRKQFTQTKLGDMFNMSQTTVHRLLKEAREARDGKATNVSAEKGSSRAGS